MLNSIYNAFEPQRGIIHELAFHQEMLALIGRCSPWKNEALVPMLGIFTNPLGMVSEYLSMGNLKDYLTANSNVMKPADLIEASACLSRALWYLVSYKCSLN